jgi:hypothetical protein
MEAERGLEKRRMMVIASAPKLSASKAPAASIRCEFQDCRNSTPAISQRKRTDQTLDLHSDSLVCREIPVI